MSIIKKNHIVEQVRFSFDENGDINDVQIQVNYCLADSITDEEETRVRKTVSLFDKFESQLVKDEANAFARFCLMQAKLI